MLPHWPRYAWLILLAALLCAALAWALTELRRWAEWHHAWLGVILVALGAALWAVDWPRAALVFGVAGLVVLADDTQSHVRQALDPAFPRSGVRGWRDAEFSPLHRLAHRLGLI